MTAARGGVRGERGRDVGRGVDRIGERDRVEQRMVRALAELRRRGVRGVAEEHDPLAVEREHRDVEVTRVGDGRQIGQRGEDRLGARLEAQDLVAPRGEAGGAPGVDAIAADAPEQADDGDVAVWRHAGGQQPEHVIRTVDDLVDLPIAREGLARIVGDDPQRAPRVRPHAEAPGVTMELAHGAVGGDHQVERAVAGAAGVDDVARRVIRRELGARDVDARVQRGAGGARAGEQRLEQDAAVHAEAVQLPVDVGVGQVDQEAPAAPQTAQAIDRRRTRAHGLEQVEAQERGLASRLERDPGAHGLGIGHALEDGHAMAGAGEEDGRSRTCGPGADDPDVQRRHGAHHPTCGRGAPGSLARSLRRR